MKVFISWSGGRSKAVALALRSWLPLPLNYIKPWVSDKDIGAGDRWAQSISGELEASNFGIICLTPENLKSEWILFESGALSKSMLDAKVIPVLFGLELSDLSGPLSQFQAQKVEQAGMLEVVRAINKVSDSAVNEDIISRVVPPLWPTLQLELDKIPETSPGEKHMRPQHDILEELVTGVRGLNSQMRDFAPEAAMQRERMFRRSRMRFHPRMVEEWALLGREPGEGPAGLLMMAGYLRDDFPWIAELLTESYREIRDGRKDPLEILHRLQRSIKMLSRGEMMGESKEAYMMIKELPMLLEISLSHVSSRDTPPGVDIDEKGDDKN